MAQRITLYGPRRTPYTEKVRRALVLKAHGYSYAEIQQLCGWTYTKVNRCMAEGRKAFLEAFAAIYGGAASGVGYGR